MEKEPIVRKNKTTTLIVPAIKQEIRNKQIEYLEAALLIIGEIKTKRQPNIREIHNQAVALLGKLKELL
jgi:hypothetical protein